MTSVWLLLSLLFSLRTGASGTHGLLAHGKGIWRPCPPMFAYPNGQAPAFPGVISLRGGWGEVAAGIMMPAENERSLEDTVDRRGKGEWGKENPMSASSKRAKNSESNAAERLPRDAGRTDSGVSPPTSARKLGKRHVRERDREALGDMEKEGAHLKPVGRSGRNVAVASKDILSWKEWETNTAGSSRVKRTQDDHGNATAIKHDGGAAPSGPKNITIPLSKLQLEAMTKKELLRVARKYSLEIQRPEDLSNRQVRDILQPYLASNPKDAIGKSRNAMTKKSKYEASIWIDGKETSVYGPGGPTDTQFETMAEQDVEEMEAKQVAEGGSKFSKREREEELTRRAQEFSDTYFRMVLTGKISVGQEVPQVDGSENSTSWGGLPEAVDNTTEFVVAPVNAAESKWVASDQRDFSHYSQYELNEKMMQAAEAGSCAGITAISKAGGSVNSVGKLVKGWTPLCSASLLGHAEAVEVLCDFGANVSARIEGSNTILHVLGWTTGSTNISKILIDFGANVDAIDDAGWTPLHCAAQAGNMAFAEMLCEAGANISALIGRNLNGKKSIRHPCNFDCQKTIHSSILLPEAPRAQQIPETAIQHQFFCATHIHHCISEPNRVREREGTNRASSQGIGRCNPEWKFSKKEKKGEISQKCTKDSARKCAGDGRFGICRGDPSKCGENLLEFIR